MKANEILEKISDVLNLSSTEVKLETMKLDNGTVIEAESFESGKEVFIVTEEEKVALPEGEYTLEDGRTLVLVEDGVIDSVGEAQSEPTEEEPQEEVEAESEEVEDVKAYASKEEVEALSAALAELTKKVEEMMPKEEMSEENKEELSKEVELSEESPVDSFKHSPEKAVKKVEGLKLSAKRQATTMDNVLNFLNK